MSIRDRNNINLLGDGDQTIIFAHGYGSDQTAWKHQVNAFKDDYRIVLFDHIGSGHSDFDAYNPRRHANLFGYAEDLLEICQHLDLHRTIYVGHSVSGMVGLLAAKLDSSLFERMVFVGASPRYLNDGDYAGGFDQSDLDALYEGMATNYFAWASGFAPVAMHNPDQPALAEEFARTLQLMRPDISLHLARAIYESDHRADLPSLTLPVLILQTQHDVAVPIAVGEYMHDKLTNSTYRLLNATGHFPHMSAPDSVNEAIREFIQS